MNILSMLFLSWLTNWKSIFSVGGVLLLWIVIWYVNLTVHQGCFGNEPNHALGEFLWNGCVLEYKRNNNYIFTAFAYFIVPAVLILSFVVSSIEELTGSR